MKMTMRGSYAAVFAAALAGALLSLPLTGWAAGRGASPALPAMDAGAAASSAAAALSHKQFSDVKVTVSGGIATLTGSVNLYVYKADAGKRVSRVRGVTAVRNEIVVAGPNVPDQILQEKLQKKLAVDRVGYDVMFNAITVNVVDGVATLGGRSRSYIASNSAVSLVSGYPGVKGVVNHIAVDPASPSDDAIRLAVARAIYGYPALSKYALTPSKPIRITVQLGHVELYGMVNSQADKQMAYLRASSVPGLFGVKNYLQVEGQPGTEGQPGAEQR
jgi:hyperosmotically inducible periplasmic protein